MKGRITMDKNILDISDQLEDKKQRIWLEKLSQNILSVLRLFSKESGKIMNMVEAHGDRHSLKDGMVYDGVDEYFYEEPKFVKAESHCFPLDIENIAPGRYVIMLEVSMDEEEPSVKYGTLTYMRKKVGEPIW